MKKICFALAMLIGMSNCGKKSNSPQPPVPQPSNFDIASWAVNGTSSFTEYFNVSLSPVIRLSFKSNIDRSTVAANIQLKQASGTPVSYNVSYERGDSTLLISPTSSLENLKRYNIAVATNLKSANGGRLINAVSIDMLTAIDSTSKFPTISDDSLMTLVQKQTFKYFWDFAHPVSGLARERNSSGDIVTSGGSGFGIMAIVAGTSRGFVTRTQALTRIKTIVSFLKNTAQRFHGAYPHWLNGATGVVVPFSAKDNGADLVETSYLIAGLITAKEYFNGSNADEMALRDDITSIVDAVEWNWFRKGSENVLYWHWSPNFGWDMNLPIRGWNECLITYVLAAASKNYSIPKTVYEQGFAQNGGMKNGTSYYGINLPLGEAFGGPLFFSHYSFLGINPNGLRDQYADYKQQVVNHSRINHLYATANPKNQFGYSSLVWGLTASDIQNGYTASSPTNDVGVIAPTAALSSMPFTPTESVATMKFFYYVLGDKIWKDYGFVDAFALKTPWFADSFLAIDQGPIIVMIENYRSGLIWNLFSSNPDVKAGLLKLGFTAPYL